MGIIIVYGSYLLLDAMIICGKCGTDERHNCVGIDYDDHVIAALMLYLDMILIFVNLLKIFGQKW